MQFILTTHSPNITSKVRLGADEDVNNIINRKFAEWEKKRQKEEAPEDHRGQGDQVPARCGRSRLPHQAGSGPQVPRVGQARQGHQLVRQRVGLLEPRRRDAREACSVVFEARITAPARFHLRAQC